MISAALSLCAVAAIFLGALILSQDFKRANNRLFASLCACFGAWSISIMVFLLAQDVDTALWSAKIFYVCAALFACLLLMFAILFPRRSQAPRWLLWAVATIGVTLSASLFFIPGFVTQEIIVASTGNYVIVNTPTYLLYSSYFVIFFFSAIGVATLKALRSRGDVRMQSGLYALGILLNSVPGFITNLVMPYFHDYSLIWVGPLASVFFLGMSTYAIVRHSLFDVRLAAVRTLAYVLSLLSLAIVYGVVVFGVSQVFFDYESSVKQNVVNIVLALFLAFLFQPIKHFFDVVTDRIFFRNSYNTQQVLDQLGDTVGRNVLLRPMLHGVLDLIQTNIRSTNIRFVLLRDDEVATRVDSPRGLDRLDNSVIAELLKLKAPMTAVDTLSDEQQGSLQAIRQLHIAVIAKLKTKQGLSGFLMLSEKASGSKYTQRDIDLLAVIVDELTVAVENSLRYEEIKAFNKTLQDKVDEATEELQQTNKKLQELDKSKDEFISMASHQLRTPLTAVKGYVSMMLDGDVGKISKEQRQVLEQAYDSSQRMVFLIGDFLNVSRLQTGRFVIEPSQIDFSNLVEEEIDQLRDTARMRDITISYEKPEGAHVSFGDENKLRQVMMNFMDNAIFYSPANSKVAVQLYKEPGFIVFKVNDQGIGVPKGAQSKLFTKFYRASNARQMRPDGTGIGIYMAKKVIVAHGGSVLFESREGVGSTFGFKLPLRDDPKQFEQQPSTTA